MRFGISLALVIAVFFIGNPDKARLQEMMLQQRNSAFTLSYFAPMRRTNYFLMSRFDITYKGAPMACFGALYAIVVCQARGGELAMLAPAANPWNGPGIF